MNVGVNGGVNGATSGDARAVGRRPTTVIRPRDRPVRPTVSVIITTRDRSDFLRQSLGSVLGQERGDFDVEIVVVDDGSTDDTPEVLRQYPVDTVVRTEGLGITGARNMGLHHATGDFIQLLDDDDLLTPRSLADRMAVFAQHPEYGSVHGRAQMTDMDLEPFGEPIPRGDRPSGWILQDLLTYIPQVGTVLTRREALIELGGYWRHFEGNDEWDVSLRTARKWPIGRIEAPSVLFRQRVGVAEEEQQWRRSRGTILTFLLNSRHLPFRERLGLRPRLWKLRGWNCSVFIMYAEINWSAGRRRRAAKSLWYAARWSPAHAALNVVRSIRSGGFSARA